MKLLLAILVFSLGHSSIAEKAPCPKSYVQHHSDGYTNIFHECNGKGKYIGMTHAIYNSDNRIESEKFYDENGNLFSYSKFSYKTGKNGRRYHQRIHFDSNNKYLFTMVHLREDGDGLPFRFENSQGEEISYEEVYKYWPPFGMPQEAAKKPTN